MKKKALAEGDQLLQLAAEHQRTVTALQVSVHARGGAPDVLAHSWQDSVSAAFNGDGKSVLVERKAFLDALLEVEERGLTEYETALDSLDEDARNLVELELIPRQRKHIAQLSSMLDHLAA